MKLTIITTNKPLRLRHEDIKCDIKNTNIETWSKKMYFRKCLNLNDYKFKISRHSYRSTHTNPVVTTNEKPTIHNTKTFQNRTPAQH